MRKISAQKTQNYQEKPALASSTQVQRVSRIANLGGTWL